MRSASWLRCSVGVSGFDECGRLKDERFGDVGGGGLAMGQRCDCKGVKRGRSVLLILYCSLSRKPGSLVLFVGSYCWCFAWNL